MSRYPNEACVFRVIKGCSGCKGRDVELWLEDDWMMLAPMMCDKFPKGGSAIGDWSVVPLTPSASKMLAIARSYIEEIPF